MAATISLAFTGDVMLGRLVDKLFPEHNVDEDDEHIAIWKSIHRTKHLEYKNLGHKFVWGDTIDLLKKVNGVFMNLETSITTHAVKYPKTFNYRVHPSNVKALVEAGVDAVSLANNHVLDYMQEGLQETIHTLERAGIAHAGAGRNVMEAREPAVINIRNARIAMFSYSDHPREFRASETTGGINWVDLEHADKAYSDIKANIEAHRHAINWDILVFSVHWGYNYSWQVPERFQRLAHKLIDEAGVHIIHGHSAHHIQGIEVYKGCPIIYGCGDFVDDYAVDAEYRNDYGLLYVAHFSLGDKRCHRLELIPVYISDFQVNCATKDSKPWQWIHSTVKTLSREFGTEVKVLTASDVDDGAVGTAQQGLLVVPEECQPSKKAKTQAK